MRVYSKLIGLVGLFMVLVFFLFGVHAYEGSKLQYCIFSFVFLSLLVSALIKPPCFSYLFVSVMLWLGFWLKFTYHTVFKLGYQEPIGAFIATPASLDHVLMIANIGCLGVLLARWAWNRCLPSSTFLASNSTRLIPAWYLKYRKIGVFLLVASMLVMCALNFYLDIFHVGVVPRTILMWPLNALTTWLLTSGFALIISTILWWEVQLQHTLTSGLICALLEALTMSVTILSRSLYIFHTIPVITACFLNRKRIKPIGLKSALSLMTLFVLFFIISLQSVTALRNLYYDNTPLELNELKAPAFLRVFNQLVIKRWLGVEGVMAVSSYEDIGWETFSKALLEKPEIGKITMYQNIAHAVYYQHIDAKRYIFGTLPGLIGFLYMSGSLLCVLGGACAIILLMMLCEKIVYYLTKNPFLCALFGMTIANTVAQIGVAPRMILKQYLLIYVYLVVVYMLQNRQYDSTFMAKLRFIRNRTYTAG